MGLRLDFMTPEGLRCHYVQKLNEPGLQPNAPFSYINASALIAALRGVIYDNPSPWRIIIPSFRIISVDFNNLTQTYDIVERQTVTHLPQPSVRTYAQNKIELQNAGFNLIKPEEEIRPCDYCRVRILKYSPSRNISLILVSSQFRLSATRLHLDVGGLLIRNNARPAFDNLAPAHGPHSINSNAMSIEDSSRSHQCSSMFSRRQTLTFCDWVKLIKWRRLILQTCYPCRRIKL